MFFYKMKFNIGMSLLKCGKYIRQYLGGKFWSKTAGKGSF